ncbi:MAG: GH32 C-terminal domain-containing protein, partial [Bacteroidaceae bacterium]|nr:GH32 C-terminal domain-containing protein [Bacteroidaceae bacterium]
RHTFAMDRTQSGITSFSPDFPTVTTAPTSRSTRQQLRLIIDRCSIEAFDGEGRWAMTNLVFPNSPYTTVGVAAGNGRGRVNALRIYPIQVK